jgi:hypothetical protein
MTLTIQIPDVLEAALKAKATASGTSADGYVQNLLQRDLSLSMEDHPGPAFKTGRGILAKYGPAPSAEEIDANRAEMFQNFAKDF